MAIFLFLILSGCGRALLTVHQQKITPDYLASTNVGSPDPRHPPEGQMIVAEWIIPREVVNQGAILRLDIIFRDYASLTVDFPIHQSIGYETYSVLNEDFERTCGFLSYRAQILDRDGQNFATWKHQLWVEMIDICENADEISSAVEAKSRHGSVIDTPASSSPN